MQPAPSVEFFPSTIPTNCVTAAAALFEGPQQCSRGGGSVRGAEARLEQLVAEVAHLRLLEEGVALLAELVEVLLEELEDEVEHVVLADHLLELDDVRVRQLAQRLHLAQLHALLPRIELLLHFLRAGGGRRWMVGRRFPWRGYAWLADARADGQGEAWTHLDGHDIARRTVHGLEDAAIRAVAESLDRLVALHRPFTQRGGLTEGRPNRGRPRLRQARRRALGLKQLSKGLF